MDKQKIRNRSLKTARQLGYPTNENLPLLDEVEQVRSTDEAGKRLLCVYAAVACSYGYPKDKALAWLSREDAFEHLADSEREYLNASANRNSNAKWQWQVEALWAMAWSLGCQSSLDFSDSCSDSFIQLLPDIAKDESTKDFQEKLTLRNSAELAAQADLAYCLHWAVRQAQTQNSPTPGKVPGDVIVERRRALEWLISGESWDEVSLDT